MAVPPVTANGTSAPSVAAIFSSSSRLSSVPQSASQASSVAAASAEPPPMPPAIGTFLSIWRCTPPVYPVARASALAALIARLLPSTARAEVSMEPVNSTLKPSAALARTSS